MAMTGLAQEVAVTERPMLFGPWKMGRILAWDFERDGDMHTRRVIKPQPPVTSLGGIRQAHDFSVAGRDYVCPYGKPGDHLWVRERHKLTAFESGRARVEYLDGTEVWRVPARLPVGCSKKWRPSIHMPRWASRITLELTEVCVERLQDITEEDAQAEGVAEPAPAHGRWCDPAKGREGHWSYRKPFAEVWDSLNKARGFGWDKNPFVWVLSFRRID